jgi:hypothetical protein
MWARCEPEPGSSPSHMSVSNVSVGQAFERLPLRDASFDLVFCIGEQACHSSASLREMYASLNRRIARVGRAQ